MKCLWIVGLFTAAALLAGCGRGYPAASAAVEGEAASPARPTRVDAKAYTVLPGGLKYATLKPGTGRGAEDQQIAIHYTGWLANGTKFDSITGDDALLMFLLGHGKVIKGWDEGMKGMKVGETRQIVVPPALGYGARGNPEKHVPPNATLIYEVELLQMASTHP
jgi:FKBP-type peptidyl-prolyl cis-trans isomerase